MRALLLALALLAGLKIWIQDSLYRTATGDAIVLAYRARAADACVGVTRSAMPAPNATVTDWTGGAEPRVTVGNPALPVRIWDFDNALWNARFRQPYLVLSVPDGALTCTYDILTGTAAVSRS